MSQSVVAPDLPDLLPARMVNEYAYCPRLAYIEWVQADFADSADTVEGRFRHRTTSDEEGDLPEEIAETDHIHARSVWLSAPDEHLTARMDLLESHGAAVTPVDYKRGAVPDTPERSWEADRVQLAAQAIVLRANGYACSQGVLYYAASKTRVPIPMDDALLAHTRSLTAEFRAVAAAGRIPPPLADSPKCVRCSLAPICLPDETNLLAADAAAPDDGIRRILPARDDAIPLYVQEQGARVSKSGETFQVRLKDTKLGEARIFETSHVCLFGNIQVTTQAVQEMCARGIPLTLFSTGGWFYGLAHGMTHKNIELRLAQYQAAADPARSLALAAQMIAAKIENCRTLLMRNHPSLPADTLTELARFADAARAAPAIATLLGIEGLAARTYFAAFHGMLKPRKDANAQPEWNFDFNGRNRRPPHDPINALLSYAYAILAKDLTIAALAVGFDPFLGFYHQPRYGRPALALDLMEEFRPLIADSVVLGVVNNAVVTPGDFMRRGPAVALKPIARKKFIQAYERRLDSLVTHPVFGYRISYRRVLEVQLRLLARLLAGEIPTYPAFRTR